MAASVKPASTSRKAAPRPIRRALRKSPAPLACCGGRQELTASDDAVPRVCERDVESGAGRDARSRRAEEERGAPGLEHRGIGAEETEACLPREEVIQIAVADVD